MSLQYSPHRLRVIALLLASMAALQAHAQNPAEPAETINDQPLVTTDDLLRGFSSAELDRVQKLIPHRPLRHFL